MKRAHAARELFLTESAVSRQINTLESNLGVRLFVRVKQRVVLTRAGKVYSAQVRRSLEHLDRDTLSIIAHGSGGGYLELAVLPTFASQWLIPRMISPIVSPSSGTGASVSASSTATAACR